MELEDAEQAYYSQWLRWGYDDQPPLYTWLQYGVNQVFGSHKVSFSMFRGLIFASILFLLWQFARKMIKDGKKAELAIMGWSWFLFSSILHFEDYPTLHCCVRLLSLPI